MTNYTTTTVEERVAAYHAEYPPLPSAEDLAGPILQGIWIIAEVFMHRASLMTHDLEMDKGFQAEARELVDTVERVASLIRACISGNLAGDNRALTFDTDSVIRALCDTSYIESVLNRPAIDQFHPYLAGLAGLDNSVEAITARTAELLRQLTT